MKRKISNKIPLVVFSLFLIFIFALFGAFFTKEILSKQTFFISPLAKIVNSKNSNLEDLLNKNNIPFTRIENDSIVLKDQGVVYIDPNKNLASQISSLHLILSRLTIEGKKFKKLDLRFDTPVIEF